MTCHPTTLRFALQRAELAARRVSVLVAVRLQVLQAKLDELRRYGVRVPTPRTPRRRLPRHAPLAVRQPAPIQPLRPIDAPPDPLGERMREAEGARALLLEVVRRAAFDWVLYRSSSRLEQKTLAEDAYNWLFVEDEDHPGHRIRRAEGKLLTAFLTICDELDLDPGRVRGYIRNLTPNKVMSSGRPPENSRASDPQISVIVHTQVPDTQGGEGSFDFDALLGQMLDG